MANNNEYISVANAFKDKTIFITGVSGFIGKVALEKILRACDAKRFYVLMRAKKGQDASKRLDGIFDSPAFENLRKIKPDFKSKITLVHGDCKLDDIGISNEDRQMLLDNVEIIMHWAATVNFNEKLKTSTNINAKSVRTLITMAKQMPQLLAFLYVSTAYSNCTYDVIDESFYDPPMEAAQLIECMDAVDENEAEELTPQMLKKWPNTYVFTKAIAENLIKTEGSGLPIIIFRPAIVMPCHREPVPGYVDNLYGPVGVTILVALGIVRILNYNRRMHMELVPADYVVNASIAAVWDVIHQGKHFKSEADVPIYNYVSSPHAPITIDKYVQYMEEHGSQVPTTKIVWHHMLFITGSRYVYSIGKFILHYVPAYLGDAVCMAIGKKPFMVRGYDKIHRLLEVLSYFSNTKLTFHDKNVVALWNKMSNDDKKLFGFNLDKFDWSEFTAVYVSGGRKYLLKEHPDTIPYGKRKMHILRVVHYVFMALLLYGLYKLFSFLLG